MFRLLIVYSDEIGVSRGGMQPESYLHMIVLFVLVEGNYDWRKETGVLHGFKR